MRPQPTHRVHSSRAFTALVVLVLGAVSALALASSASAATPCGKKVLADWFDNSRIDRIYPLNCYEEAIDAIPPDLRDYANAEEVITRALQSALHGELPPVGKGAGSRGGGTDPGSGQQAAPDVNTAGPSSVPVPLLVLGGLSLALLAAGGLGYASRRRQAAHAEDEDDYDPLS